MKKRPLTTKSGEVREATLKEMRTFQPAHKVLPAQLLAILPKRKIGQRGSQKKLRKKLLTMRYSEEVIRYFKSTGAGWQSRMNAALKEWIKKHPRVAS